MEDAFQFIIESPQTTTGHKKRPRLVTSCDNCRLKKIKCLQSSPETKCEACKAAKIPCKFKDRERYFAERSRAIAGPNVATAYTPIEERAAENGSSMDAFSISGAPYGSSGPSSRATHSPKPSGAVAADPNASGRFQPYPTNFQPGHRHSTSSPINSSYPSHQAQGGYNYMASTPLPLVQQPQRINLFDQDNAHYPNRTLITEFTEQFIRHHAHNFPFVNVNEIWKQVWSGTLPAPFASCIASLACKHSTRADLTHDRTTESVAEAYAENAKTMLGRRPAGTMAMLHTLILLAWAEQRLGKADDARTHYDMAMRMAVDLGMTNSSINLIGDQRDVRVLTWGNLVELHHALSAR
ncbi:hypothetical protein BD626DRAFT_473478 [Schizophyllum amplum]|uniref:Zn(2)-C6 fungal-type domain-containing protein n=1 Tax=Schizophyllum amplum TaxID=97359 RepID=A0A550CWT6_9AGAR|nr:hypothetical protein BD626DRAFT_473478 [Auriculariopsis ampla]